MKNILRTLSLSALLSCPLTGISGVDSFFDIVYDVSLDAAGSPVVRATDYRSGEAIPVAIDRSARFNNADKSTEFRIDFAQRAGRSVETLRISASCVDRTCMVTDIAPGNGKTHGHVTVLK